MFQGDHILASSLCAKIQEPIYFFFVFSILRASKTAFVYLFFHFSYSICLFIFPTVSYNFSYIFHEQFFNLRTPLSNCDEMFCRHVLAQYHSIPIKFSFRKQGVVVIFLRTDGEGRVFRGINKTSGGRSKTLVNRGIRIFMPCSFLLKGIQ